MLDPTWIRHLAKMETCIMLAAYIETVLAAWIKPALHKSDIRNMLETYIIQDSIIGQI